MRVKKTFEVTFDEPFAHWLSAGNLAGLLREGCQDVAFHVKELSCEPRWSGDYRPSQQVYVKPRIPVDRGRLWKEED